MLKAETKTVFVAARGDQILSDGFDTPELAEQQVKHLNEQMEALGLEPDLHIGEVQVKTTIGRVKRHRLAKATESEEGADDEEVIAGILNAARGGSPVKLTDLATISAPDLFERLAAETAMSPDVNAVEATAGRSAITFTGGGSIILER